ncbi:MAG: DNA pilot protein [Microviridae sp.]|nr:MAG: DNA pilot protein [Microviridae sp.]
MPLSALGAILGPIGNFTGAMNTAFENRQNRQFSVDMYERQNRDTVDFWNKQNAYNSPVSQMQRFKDAGLSPWLMYSQGNAGNAAPLTPATPQRPEFNSTQFDGGIASGVRGIDDYYNLIRLEAGVVNANAQNELLQQEIRLRRTQADRAALDYKLESGLFDTNTDYRRERLRGQSIMNDNAAAENVRREIQLSSNLREATERILSLQVGRDRTGEEIRSIQERIKLMKQDGTLRDLEIDMRRMSVSWNDELWQRFIARILTSQGFNTGIHGEQRR